MQPSTLEFIRGDNVDLLLDFGTNITGAKVYFTAKTIPDDDSDDSTAVLKGEQSTHTTRNLNLFT